VEDIVLYTLPDISLTPRGLALTPELRAAADALVEANNLGLKGLAAAYALEGIDVTVVDVNRLTEEVAADRETFGLEILETPLYVPGPGGTLVATGAGAQAGEENVAFFDPIHPTAETHEIVAAFSEATIRADLTDLRGDLDDVVLGLFGDEFVFGGGGEDLIYAWSGSDTVFAGLGDDEIRGGRGDDFLAAGSGDDFVWGGLGDDFIAGNAGNDRLSGGEGDDVIIDSSGGSRIFGDAGDDLILFTADGTGTKEDVVDGGRGDDALRLSVPAETFASTEFQAEFAAFTAGFSSGAAPSFTFDSLDLTVRGVESVQVYVDGAATEAVAGAPAPHPERDRRGAAARRRLVGSRLRRGPVPEAARGAVPGDGVRQPPPMRPDLTTCRPGAPATAASTRAAAMRSGGTMRQSRGSTGSRRRKRRLAAASKGRLSSRSPPISDGRRIVREGNPTPATASSASPFTRCRRPASGGSPPRRRRGRRPGPHDGGRGGRRGGASCGRPGGTPRGSRPWRWWSPARRSPPPAAHQGASSGSRSKSTTGLSSLGFAGRGRRVGAATRSTRGSASARSRARRPTSPVAPRTRSEATPSTAPVVRDEGSEALGAGGLEHLPGGAVLLDPPLVQEDRAVRHVAGEAHLVGDHQHGAALLGEGAHDPEHLADELRVEAEVGSSKSMTRGLCASARAIAARCCWPPDRWAG
jgi:hypothetical protein